MVLIFVPNSHLPYFCLSKAYHKQKQKIYFRKKNNILFLFKKQKQKQFSMRGVAV